MPIVASKTLATCTAALALAACSGGPALPSLPSAVSLASVSSLTVGSISSEPSRIPHPSAEVYSRVARGANACWFGRGRLGKSHLMHADVASPMNGGAAELVVHERAVDQPKPWGFKAFRVVMTETPGADGPGTGSTEISVENTRIPDAEAARMRAEVFQWASGTEGCKSDPALDKPAQPLATEIAPAPAVKAKAAAKAQRSPQPAAK